MATQNIKYTLNVQLADNVITVEDKNDKIAVLVPAGTADKQRVISEIMEVNPGLERETVEAVLNLENRVVKKLLLTGFRVNTGLYSAVAQPSGVVEGNRWDPEKNSLYVSFTQGSDMRAAIGETSVNIIGEKGNAMYISGGQDSATGAMGFTATAGRNFILTGARLKVAGNAPEVGVTLTSAATGTVTEITTDMLAVNDPRKLILLIPAGLADGEYTLSVTTQFSGNSTQPLKSPRTVEQVIYIGKAPSAGTGGNPGGSTGGGTTGGGSTGGENPGGGTGDGGGDDLA